MHFSLYMFNMNTGSYRYIPEPISSSYLGVYIWSWWSDQKMLFLSSNTAESCWGIMVFSCSLYTDSLLCLQVFFIPTENKGFHTKISSFLEQSFNYLKPLIHNFLHILQRKVDVSVVLNNAAWWRIWFVSTKWTGNNTLIWKRVLKQFVDDVIRTPLESPSNDLAQVLLSHDCD